MASCYRFPCGCSFPILEPGSEERGVMPLLDFDIEKVPQDCPATFGLLGTGNVKGVFQLESNLGKAWTKKLKPETLEHVGALTAILRPGALKSKTDDGISMTQHYINRKNGKEEVASYHPVIDAILWPTYGVLAYQEQSIFIAVAVAGFSPVEADQLRKNIGKKLALEMAKSKIAFLDGAKRVGVLTDAQAEEVFGWIQESQRYSFNHSHAICYGLLGYDTAFVKAHFPLAFFSAWLNNAKHKKPKPQDEVNALVHDARLFNVTIEAPDFRDMESTFYTNGRTIQFGLRDIKGFGDVQDAKFQQAIQNLSTPISKMSWLDFLVASKKLVCPSVVPKLIQVGAFRWLNMPRTVMLAEFDVWDSLTDKEKVWLEGKELPASLTLTQLLKMMAKPKKEGGACATKRRVATILSQIQLLENPPTKLVDTAHWMAWTEQQLLGISVTCNKTDSCDMSAINTTCKEFATGKTGYMLLGVEINKVHEIKTKAGKSPGSKMARITVSDGTCAVDAVAFPDSWKEFSSLLNPGNTVLIQGDRDKEGSSLIIKKVWQANLIF